MYTEEQVLQFINFYESVNPKDYGGFQHVTMDGSERLHNNQTIKNILNTYTESITPIELPSDEEIEDVSGGDVSFELGAKWMRDKIQGGIK